MEDDELLRSVARFQREMLRKRQAQDQVKLQSKELKSLGDKGKLLSGAKLCIMLLYTNLKVLNSSN